MYTFVFASPVRLCLQTKLPSALMTGYTGIYLPVARDFQAKENIALDVRTFHNGYRSNYYYNSKCFFDLYRKILLEA